MKIRIEKGACVGNARCAAIAVPSKGSSAGSRSASMRLIRTNPEGGEKEQKLRDDMIETLAALLRRRIR